jgi:hypothetical protein
MARLHRTAQGFSPAALFVILALCAPAAYCGAPNHSDESGGTLGKFEKDVQPPADPAPRPADGDRRRDREHHDGDSLGDELVSSFGDLVVSIFADLGNQTLLRLAPDAQPPVRRDDGDILIPFVRYDFAYQHITSSINADSNRLEAGYGPYAFSLEQYTFRESAPSFTLTVDSATFLYRISLSKAAEVDFGLGHTTITGAQRTTLNTVTLPVKIALTDNTALELRPAWSGTLADYELALHWGMPYWSAKIGVRTLNSPGTSLRGPFAGFSLHF